MKSSLCTLILVVFSVCSFAQNRKTTTIYCTVSPTGKMNYYDLAKLLPDSLVAAILVDPMKDHSFKNGLNVLMWMSQHGWNLASTLTGPTDFSFLLTREIDLADNARALFAQKLEEEVKK